MIRRPPRSTQSRSSAASDVYKRQVLVEAKGQGQVVLRYCSPEGSVLPEFNPNGATANIAGVCNPEGNVLGLMPHPERASEAELGSTDGLVIWRSLLDRCGVEVAS